MAAVVAASWVRRGGSDGAGAMGVGLGRSGLPGWWFVAGVSAAGEGGRRSLGGGAGLVRAQWVGCGGGARRGGAGWGERLAARGPRVAERSPRRPRRAGVVGLPGLGERNEGSAGTRGVRVGARGWWLAAREEPHGSGRCGVGRGWRRLAIGGRASHAISACVAGIARSAGGDDGVRDAVAALGVGRQPSDWGTDRSRDSSMK